MDFFVRAMKTKKAFNPTNGIEDFGVKPGALRCVASKRVLV
jgi:hypothetical protein